MLSVKTLRKADRVTGLGEFPFFLYVFLLVEPREIHFKREKHLLLSFLEADPEVNILVQVVSGGETFCKMSLEGNGEHGIRKGGLEAEMWRH